MATNKNPYSDIDLSIYADGYKESDVVKEAAKKKKQAEDAVDNYGDFYYKNQGALDLALQNLQNRKFSYDLNADALYQQYKDNYITQGKQASVDVMGQAAALTGGYGNSYAATVGNQTYQGYLTQLNNIAPELYRLALDKYNSEGTDLMNQIGAFQSDKQMEYGIWGDGLNRLMQDRSYYSDDYNNAYNRDYTMWSDNRDYDTNMYWNEYNAGYQKERDAVADEQWNKEFNLAQEQFNWQKSQSGSGSKKVEDDGDINPDVKKQNFLTIEDAVNYMVERGIDNEKVKDVNLYDAREWKRQKELGNSRPEFKYDSYQEYLSAYVYYVECNQ